jgi:hypothetical protein
VKPPRGMVRTEAIFIEGVPEKEAADCTDDTDKAGAALAYFIWLLIIHYHPR